MGNNTKWTIGIPPPATPEQLAVKLRELADKAERGELESFACQYETEADLISFHYRKAAL